jgi:membrane associated rhomboid family serine protease
MIPIGDDPPRHRFPWVTIVLIVANVLVFVYQLSLPERQLEIFVQGFGTVPREILSGRDLPPPAPGPVWITLFTAIFIHGGFLHLGSNMLYLWVFGDNVEDRLGHMTYLFFYLTAGIVAGLTHVFFNPQSTIPSVGASGAIAGVLGGYLLMFPGALIRTLVILGPILLFPRISAILMIGFWFLMQFLAGLLSLGAATEQTSGVAVWAHIGGFVAGVLLALVLRPRRPARPVTAW